MRSTVAGRLSLAAMLAVALVAAGCGGDDNPSKAEFLKKGNAICRKGNQAINQGARRTFLRAGKPSGPPPPAELEKFATDTLIPNVQRQIDQIRDLGAPSGDEDQVNAILDQAQAALDKGKKDPTILTSEKQDPFQTVNKLAKDYGLTVCGAG
jgi:hypothetical protein